MIENNEQLFSKIQKLVEAWCDRRCLIALRQILPGYPLTSPLTDGWGELLIALKNVSAFARYTNSKPVNKNCWKTAFGRSTRQFTTIGSEGGWNLMIGTH